MSISNTSPDVPDQTASVKQLCSAVRSCLIVLGTLLAGHGLGQSGLYFWVEAAAGSVMVLGPAIWGVYTAFTEFMAKRHAATVGVMAGIAAQQGAASPMIPQFLSHTDAAAIIATYKASTNPPKV